MAKLISYESGPRLIPDTDKGGDVLLMPGVNDIDPELFKRYQDHPVIKYLLSLGEKGGLVYDAKTSLQSLATVKSPKECKALIDDCFNLELLQKWLDAEERPQVQRLLETKIKDIKDPDKKPDNEKDE